MPLVETSTYSPPKLFKNGHFQTIYPYLFRQVSDVCFKRERIITPDQDFLDLDWIKGENSNLVILSHGLEGCSNSPYIRGMAKSLQSLGCDILAWNMRSCSGEMNLKSRYYHAGDVEDFDFVLKHALAKKEYKKVFLIGFSLGANLTAKYLGVYRHKLPGNIFKSVLFSNPVDLKASDRELHRRSNIFYMDIFLKTMKRKIREKSEMMTLPNVDVSRLDNIRSLADFNNLFVAPLHGFKNIDEYYNYASCKQDLQNIQIPTLIVNAKNDPFLAKECFPLRQARKNPNLFLEIPRSGGHIGFVCFRQDYYWSESRAIEFLKD